MGFIKINVVVHTEDIQRLEQAAPQIDAEIAENVSIAIQEGAQQRAPVLTGALRDGIQRATSGGRFWVISTMDYGSFVEYGTRKMAAQPHMHPAAEAADIDGIAQQAVRNAGF